MYIQILKCEFFGLKNSLANDGRTCGSQKRTDPQIED